MKKILFLALLLSIGLGSSAIADFIDDFDVAHDYLADGFAGTGWSGLMTGDGSLLVWDPATMDPEPPVIDASITAAGKLHILQGGTWQGDEMTDAPFLYKEVTGDFVAEVLVDSVGAYSAAGLFVRLADVAAGGAGEDSMLLCNWKPWNVGSIFWPTDDGVRVENDITRDGDAGAPYKYMRVERVGANFYWSRSTNGTTWEVLADTGNPMVREDMNVATLQVGVIENFGHWEEPGESVQFEYVKILEPVVTLSGATSVNEEGATSTTITVDLINGAPTAAVDIVITEVPDGDPNDLLLGGALSPLTVSFAIGETQKTFTAQAIDDDLLEGPEAIQLIAASSSADSSYSADHPNGRLTIDVLDNDQGSLLIDQGDGLLVDEDLVLSDSFDVSLTKPLAAAGTVTVDISTDGETEVSPSQLTFDETNWSDPQSVNVIAVDDNDSEDDPHTSTIALGITSADTNYNDIPDDLEISANVQENDCGAWDYSDQDLNQDCVVNLADLAVLASQWSQSTLPNAAGSVDAR